MFPSKKVTSNLYYEVHIHLLQNTTITVQYLHLKSVFPITKFKKFKTHHKNASIW